MQKHHSKLPQTTTSTRGQTLYANIPATKSDFNLHTVTRKIILEQKMQRLTEVWRSLDAPREVTGDRQPGLNSKICQQH